MEWTGEKLDSMLVTNVEEDYSEKCDELTNTQCRHYKKMKTHKKDGDLFK